MKDVSKCAGCRNDFYNGHNSLGVKECWSLKDAKIVSRIRVHRDQMPPYKQKPVKVYSCRMEQGFVLVKPEAIRKDGYWA